MKDTTIPIIPLNDRVLIEQIKESKTPGGLELPTSKVQFGNVLAIGLGAGEFIGEQAEVNKDYGPVRGLKVGDKVFIPRNIGEKYEVNEKQYILMPISQIVGIVPR